MDKKVAGLLGAAATLTAVTGAQATPVQPSTIALNPSAACPPFGRYREARGRKADIYSW